MCFTFFFTFSRGGWIALAVALVLYFAFTTTRLASFITLLAVVTPVGLVLWRLRGLEDAFAATIDDAQRTLQGGVLLRWAITALLVAAGIQLAVALLHQSYPLATLVDQRGRRGRAPGRGRGRLRRSGCYVQTHGGASWVKDRLHALVTDAESERRGNAVARLTTLTTNGRIPLARGHAPVPLRA